MKVHDVLTGALTVCSQKEWTARGALYHIVRHFKHTGRVWYDGEWHNPFLLYRVKELENIKAQDMRICFWGGPDPVRRYRDGSMLDYLIDSCFYEIAQHDPDLRLWNFLEAACGVRAGAP